MNPFRVHWAKVATSLKSKAGFASLHKSTSPNQSIPYLLHESSHLSEDPYQVMPLANLLRTLQVDNSWASYPDSTKDSYSRPPKAAERGNVKYNSRLEKVGGRTSPPLYMATTPLLYVADSDQQWITVVHGLSIGAGHMMDITLFS